MTTASHIQPFLEALSSNWKQALSQDEWFFAGIIEDVTSQMSASDAFDSIDALVEILAHQNDPTTSYYCGAFLVSLARRSDTSELPVGLRTEWDCVENHLADYLDILGQLRDWYRTN
jgi:hypothetical protein